MAANDFVSADTFLPEDYGTPRQRTFTEIAPARIRLQARPNTFNRFTAFPEADLVAFPFAKMPPLTSGLAMTLQEKEPFFKNRRNVYSSLWAYASLNYLYADVVGLMDQNVLVQYQAGVVNGVNITPGFLTLAAGFMQIPLANVFLPQVIKNEKTLRWIQIASGTAMTLVQAGTLFAGKPTPYYVLFSAFEIAATSYITIDAIRWKPKSSKKQIPRDAY
jgi:hypothetical protein